jgi:hypothetical protein
MTIHHASRTKADGETPADGPEDLSEKIYNQVRNGDNR